MQKGQQVYYQDKTHHQLPHFSKAKQEKEKTNKKDKPHNLVHASISINPSLTPHTRSYSQQ